MRQQSFLQQVPSSPLQSLPMHLPPFEDSPSLDLFNAARALARIQHHDGVRALRLSEVPQGISGNSWEQSA
jgi:hypothetical protein